MDSEKKLSTKWLTILYVIFIISAIVGFFQMYYHLKVLDNLLHKVTSTATTWLESALPSWATSWIPVDDKADNQVRMAFVIVTGIMAILEFVSVLTKRTKVGFFAIMATLVSQVVYMGIAGYRHGTVELLAYLAISIVFAVTNGIYVYKRRQLFFAKKTKVNM